VVLARYIEVLVLFFAGHGNLSTFESDSSLYPPDVGDMCDHNTPKPRPTSSTTSRPDPEAEHKTGKTKTAINSPSLGPVPDLVRSIPGSSSGGNPGDKTGAARVAPFAATLLAPAIRVALLLALGPALGPARIAESLSSVTLGKVCPLVQISSIFLIFS
jgi:hypothetical protein